MQSTTTRSRVVLVDGVCCLLSYGGLVVAVLSVTVTSKTPAVLVRLAHAALITYLPTLWLAHTYDT
jgi:hypothetical protein